MCHSTVTSSEYCLHGCRLQTHPEAYERDGKFKGFISCVSVCVWLFCSLKLSLCCSSASCLWRLCGHTTVLALQLCCFRISALGARSSQLYLSDVVIQPTEGQLPNVKGAAAIMFAPRVSWERYEDAFSLIFNIRRVQISPRKD